MGTGPTGNATSNQLVQECQLLLPLPLESEEFVDLSSLEQSPLFPMQIPLNIVLKRKGCIKSHLEKESRK